MTGRDADLVAWLQAKKPKLLERVCHWSRISSHSLDQAGMSRMANELTAALQSIGAVRRMEVPARDWIDEHGRRAVQPLGDVLAVRHIAPREQLRVLLAIHYDTVYPAAGNQPPPVELVDHGRILRGPGVADAKGGIAVMLGALEAAMHFGAGETLSWEVLLNADEELGSPGSVSLLTEAASRHDLGLVFEPALDDAGTLASSRKGSGNFTVVIQGKAAHAGRNPVEGRNAVVAAANLATTLTHLNDQGHDVTINVAAIHGGDAFNVVPDRAVVRVNVRAAHDDGADWTVRHLKAAVDAINARDGYSASLHGGIHCPPKPLDDRTQRLLAHVVACGHDLGLPITSRPTGGVCDGNKLAAAGLPTLDTLGVRGGGIHSPDEYLVVESLSERAALVAILLTRLANGSLAWPRSDRAVQGGASCS